MIRRYMLDTNMVSYIVSGKSQAARARLRALSPFETACISCITEGELRYGMARKPEALNRHSALLQLMTELPALPWESRAAEAYGTLRAKQDASGKSVATMDLLIAAHALAANCVLVTRDNVFVHVSGLIGLQNWATDL